ncbi:MAG: hypothetical protein H6709_03935 [Kofleriaceae bacterium]|nr:hypothetical protein [Kofleriaceae bacterium]
MAGAPGPGRRRRRRRRRRGRRRRVARWDADSRRRADAGERLAELAVRLADGRARLAAAEAAAVTATTTATDAARARRARAADERAALLGGRATAAAAAALDARRAALETLHRSVAGARAVVDERGARLAAHRAAAPPDATAGDDVSAALAAAVAARAAADDRHRRATLALEVDDAARAQRAACAAELARRTDAAEVHRQLAELIGSHDGKKLRTFAQSLSLDGLLAAANHHLIDLAPRYRLERVRGHDLELQIVDRDMGDEVRSVNSLSGGESFLVSLALALGLSSLSARNVRVRTLLIDEGFGTLDPSTLDVALDVLDTLQSSGRQVGIISHVPGLAERVPAQVVVRPTGAGRSTVVVRAAG